jgi:anti-sigma regulatory factor (Ser/Thr protein kinase)
MRSAAAAETDHSAWTPALPGWNPSEPAAAQATASKEVALSGQGRPEAGTPGVRALPEQRSAAECPAAVSARWQFPAQPVHARMARIWLEAWISDRGLGQDASYCAAVAFSELVTNAVLHGAGPVTVEVAIVAGRIECEVSDGARDLPVVCEAGEDDEHHRGMSLVEALTADWRVRLRPEGGKAVAFVVEA